MDGKALARIVAVIFVAFAVTATALGMIRKDEPAAGSTVPPPMTLSPSRLREGLRRCQGLGEAALLDSDCTRLWAEQRDRFLGFSAQSTNAAPVPAVPLSPDESRHGTR
jgi:conjugative transfer region protein TrbK